MKNLIMIASVIFLVLYFAGTVGCCRYAEEKLKKDMGGLPGEPSEETGTPEISLRSFDAALAVFIQALKNKDPRDFEPLAGSTVLIGEPFTEGEFMSRDEFVALLSDGSSPYARALYSDERVSSFVNEFDAGTLDKTEWGSGGYSAATTDYTWFVAFEPAADGNWHLKVCAVALVQ